MSLNPGTKLGPYKILVPLGAGGMGEVYKATDTRLDRTVAVKVLPSHLSDNARLKERFEREARAVSSLNHPHICTLYDIGSENGIDFMVMEHIEGDTLADRLKKGPLPLDRALQYGSEIAGALDKAHRQGVVHRDLKPGNIMITKSGAKLLDFGLAKTTAQQTNAASLSALPTESQPLTKEGSILGTLQYMAPEQLEGKEADNRTDIFAFGAVLYEMVTGKRAFEGKSQASLIAAILDHDPPPLREAREAAPPALSRVVEVCLAKVPDERWQSIADVARQLGWFVDGREETDAVAGKTPSQSLRAFAILAVVMILLAALAVWWIKPATPVPGLPSRLTVAFPPGIANPQAQKRLERNIAISPDGRLLVYMANRNGTSQLFLRPLDQFEASPIRGTEEGFSPFLSPDGKWIGFFTSDKLQKIPIEGGIPVPLASVSRGGGGSWGPDGQIVYMSADSGLLKISEDGGGVPETLRRLRYTSTGATVPHILPDGKHVLYTEGRGGDLKINVLSLSTGESRSLPPVNASSATYLPSGHLVYAQSSGLTAERFDLDQLELSGAPVPVVRNVFMNLGTGAVQYAVSRSGTLVYLPAPTENRLVWVDRQGEPRPLMDATSPGIYLLPRLSPDESRLSVVRLDRSTNRREIWVRDLEREDFEQLTSTGFEQAHEQTWSPDSKRIVFAGQKTGMNAADRNIFVASVDGTGEPQPLTEGGQSVPSSWSGNRIFFHRQSETGRDIGVVRCDEPGSDEIIIEGDSFQKFGAVLAPNELRLAYVSNESGPYEVYVRPFPALDRQKKVSSGGGTEPIWAASGQELFYRSGNKMMVVDVQPGGEFSTPVILFDKHFAVDPVGNDAANYDVRLDGKQFIMIEEQQPPPRWNAVLNWTEELKRLVPTEN